MSGPGRRVQRSAEQAAGGRTARRDLRGALLALAFVLLLMGSEAALALPEETDSGLLVASFYAQHRVAIIVLQLVGLAAAGVLAAYARRLRRVDAVVGATGALTAVLACAPSLVTIVLALVADPAHPNAAGTWNALEPRADDLLFLGITAFGAAVALRPRFARVARVLGAIVAVLCASRLVLEAAGQPRGSFDSLGPISFVVLVAGLGVLSALGRLAAAPPASAL
jgi:hypothetical protein